MSEVMTVPSIASRHHQISQIIIDIAAAHFTWMEIERLFVSSAIIDV